VIRLIDHGQVDVPEAGPLLSEVPYLILELADGDIRAYQAQSDKLDCSWAFRVMKHTCQGIEQLHSTHTAHQDLKPSNVLTQNHGYEMKLGDLGRADKREADGPWSDLDIPGAVAYAPPEQQYGAFGRTWEERKAADLYLAGSLGAQVFLGHCMSVLIQESVPPQFRPNVWEGSFEDVLPYLQNGHAEVILNVEAVVRDRSGEQRFADRFATAI
jgi:serine/threonine protein kinase